MDEGINIVRIFSPEHGYLGNKSAGKKIENDVDSLSGIEIVESCGLDSIDNTLWPTIVIFGYNLI